MLSPTHVHAEVNIFEFPVTFVGMGMEGVNILLIDGRTGIYLLFTETLQNI